MREGLAHERSRFLLDMIAEASRTDHPHLVDSPLAELLLDADETLKWTVLTYLAASGYRPAQIELSSRCAAEGYLVASLRDAVRGRTLDVAGRRLLTRALNDAEWMVGYAAGWGAIANGARSRNRREDSSLTDHAKDLGVEVISGLWAAVATDARDDGYREGYATASDGADSSAKVACAALAQAFEVGRGEEAPSRVVISHSTLPPQERRASGVGDIVGKTLPLVTTHLLTQKRRDLRDAHPHAAELIERILGDLREGHAVSFRPTLLVGAPGTGKSRLCRDLLDTFGIPFAPIDAGTTMDHGLTGSARRWSGAYPSVPVRLWVQHKVANPGVLVDELEKAGRSSAGSVHDPLLSLLEPISAERWRDLYLDTEVDASKLNWLFTANSTSSIPGPLLSRLRVCRVPLPSLQHVPALANRIRLDLLRERSLAPAMEPAFDAEELTALSTAFGAQGSLRDLKRYVEGVLDARMHTTLRN
ncbi:AAA family ATPase [Aureimonas pseudogalii]|nr:AAA family ATPase [Aureimonas pseudogalii]